MTKVRLIHGQFPPQIVDKCAKCTLYAKPLWNLRLWIILTGSSTIHLLYTITLTDMTPHLLFPRSNGLCTLYLCILHSSWEFAPGKEYVLKDQNEEG